MEPGIVIPLLLRKVIAVDNDGSPRLEGVNARTIALQPFGIEHVGRDAVCQMSTDEEGIVVVFGVIESKPSEDSSDARPLEFRCGRSVLLMAPDGSIRLEGTNVSVSSSGRVKLNAALIDLN